MIGNTWNAIIKCIVHIFTFCDIWCMHLLYPNMLAYCLSSFCYPIIIVFEDIKYECYDRVVALSTQTLKNQAHFAISTPIYIWFYSKILAERLTVRFDWPYGEQEHKIYASILHLRSKES